MKKTVLLVLQILFAATPGIICCYPPVKRSGSTCGKLKHNLVQRNHWCAREPTGSIDCMWGPVRYIIIHHTVSGACDTPEACSEEMKKLQKDHMENKKWPDVGYHYVIGGDGRAYVGRPCAQMGGHTKNHNRKSIGIAFFGDYQKDVPSSDMLELVPKIAYCAVEQGYLHPDFIVIGHRDAFCSTCPGDALYDVIKKWAKYAGSSVPLPSYTCDTTTTKEEEPTTTTEAATTTTEPTTTSTTEAATTVPAEDGGSSPKVVALPIHVYLLLHKKPCCHEW